MDLRLNASGDLYVYKHDVSTIEDYPEDIQHIIVRLKTRLGEAAVATSLGNQLVALLGMPNDTKTAQKGYDFITEALCHDEKFGEENYTIRAWKMSESQIHFQVTLDIPGETPMSVVVPLDLNEGYSIL